MERRQPSCDGVDDDDGRVGVESSLAYSGYIRPTLTAPGSYR
jgi:hypothetical protein